MRKVKVAAKAPKQTKPLPTTLVVEIDPKLLREVETRLAARGSSAAIFCRLQLKALTLSGRLLGLADKLNFGKYAGELVEDVCRADTGYVEWLLANSTSPKFAPDVVELMVALAELDKPAKPAA